MEHRNGVWFGTAAYAVWGLAPLFWNLVDGIATIDLLLHRMLWAVPMLGLAIALRRQWHDVRDGYASWRPRLATVAAALLLTVNWGVFVWAVTNDQIVEASLGYFINPLVSVALGVLVLGERLRPAQWASVGLAALGVASMAIRIGSLPWVSLALAFSFGTYGLLKKRTDAPKPLISLFGEVSVLAIPALIVLVLTNPESDAAFGSSPGVSLFLISAGAITVIPLLLFGASAKRIPLSTIGVLQYIAPTLQFLLGVAVFGESLSADKAIGFLFVWAALSIFTWDGWRNRAADSRRQTSDSR